MVQVKPARKTRSAGSKGRGAHNWARELGLFFRPASQRLKLRTMVENEYKKKISVRKNGKRIKIQAKPEAGVAVAAAINTFLEHILERANDMHFAEVKRRQDADLKIQDVNPRIDAVMLNKVICDRESDFKSFVPDALEMAQQLQLDQNNLNAGLHKAHRKMDKAAEVKAAKVAALASASPSKGDKKGKAASASKKTSSKK